MRLFTFESEKTQTLALSWISLFNKGVVWYQFDRENSFISNHWIPNRINPTVKEL